MVMTIQELRQFLTYYDSDKNMAVVMEGSSGELIDRHSLTVLCIMDEVNSDQDRVVLKLGI